MKGGLAIKNIINSKVVHSCCILIALLITAYLVYTFVNKNIEGLDNKTASINSTSFCNTFGKDTSKLQKACARLTDNNCQNIGCCVWANGDKCLAGNATGPTYKTDSEGKQINITKYYHMNKCYGKGCV